MSDNSTKRFRESLNLPKTDFPIVFNSKIVEPQIVKFWEDNAIYQNHVSIYASKNKDKKIFVLPSGPPYANGPIHLGHALNVILKDIVVKKEYKAGKAVHFTFVSDCHGLPIENKMAEKLKISKDEIAKDVVGFKKQCRDFAQGWIEVQKESFKNLGVFAEFEKSRSTMDFSYQSSIVRAFGLMYNKGFVFRRERSLNWCINCATVLSDAEIEYKNRIDNSVFVKFEMTQDSEQVFLSRLGVDNVYEKVSFLVWTTTPWTLPLNKALSVNPEAKYSLVKFGKDYLIVGMELVNKLENKLKSSIEVIKSFSGKEYFQGLFANHILQENEIVPVIFDETIELLEGTAIVHNAPGCGASDYLLGIKNNLEIFSPVSEHGKYTAAVKIKELVGLSVYAGAKWVIESLKNSEKLLLEEDIDHSYPHCWRCRKGIIFRATKQWFCDLSKNDLQKKTIAECEKIKFLPDWGANRFKAFVGGRQEWCISRQRYWGVPIVAIRCTECDDEFVSTALIEFVAGNIELQGIEFWDRLTISDLKSNNIISQDFTCEKCSSQSWKKEQDILDVWFDSGVFHTAILKQEDERLFPMDVQLEGSDQHRGWFQSSMLTSMMMYEKACTKMIVTHGFLVDEKGFKMSKSMGNGVEPNDIISKYGTDVMRFWVAASDFSKDIAVSMNIVKYLAENYRKIRNTCRFLLSNMYDQDNKALIETEFWVNYDWNKISMLDRFAIKKLHSLIQKIDEYFVNYKFVTITHDVNNFCTIDMSSLYFEMTKDRLYAGEKNGVLRKSAQVTYLLILYFLIDRLSPITSFLCENIYQTLLGENVSIFQNVGLPINSLKKIEQDWDSFFGFNNFEKAFDLLLKIRESLFKKIEKLREKAVLNQSIEVRLEFFVDSGSCEGEIFQNILDVANKKEGVVPFLKGFFSVSQVVIASSSMMLDSTNEDWLFMNVVKAHGIKCPRCWCWHEDFSNLDDLCSRCFVVFKN